MLAVVSKLLGPFLSPDNPSTLERLPEIVQAILIAVGFFAGYLEVFTIFYGISAFYWLPPYTIMAMFLYIWSLNKKKTQVYKVFMWSPVFLGILITIYLAFIANFSFIPSLFESEDLLPFGYFCALPASIALGYFFIGLVAFIHDFLHKRGTVIDESP
jgi:hypothetical protein